MKNIAILAICLAVLNADARPWPDSTTQIVAFAATELSAAGSWLHRIELE